MENEPQIERLKRAIAQSTISFGTDTNPSNIVRRTAYVSGIAFAVECMLDAIDDDEYKTRIINEIINKTTQQQ